MSALSAPGGGGTTSAPAAPPAQHSKPATSGKSKFQKLDINNLYCHSRGENLEPSSVKSQLSRKHGMQSLGKVPSARRPPANLPSLKTESGQETNTSSISGTPPSQPPPLQQGSAPVAPPAPVGPPPSPPTAAPQQPGQTCPQPQQNTTSHQHAGGYPGGWAALPPHRTAQFQQEFPSLDGGPPPHQPSLRPQTEGSWLAGGGSRAGAPDGPAPASDPRAAFNRALPLPPFMCKGSTGAGGPGGYPPVFGASGGPPSSSRHHPPPNRGQQRMREVPTIDKMVQRPIIREEELTSMDDIAKDAGWATHDDIDYNQKLAFSDEESPSKDTGTPKQRAPQPVLEKERPREPAVLAKNIEDDEVWAMRQRQHSSEVAAAVERARQRKLQEERRYQQQLQEATAAMSEEPKVVEVVPEVVQGPPQEPEKPPQTPREAERSPSNALPLDRSTSRDSIRNGPEQPSSDFRQLTQIGDARNFRDQKERGGDRDRRDRDYPRDRDFYRESDRDWDNHPRPERERDRDTRSDRDGPGFNKYFNSNLPPRFAKQQGRGGQQGGQQQQQQQQQQDRMSFNISDRTDFGRSNSGGSFNQDSKHRNDQRNSDDNKSSVPFSQQYDPRWAFPNMKPIQGGPQRENFHHSSNSVPGKRNEGEGKGLRRIRTDSEIAAKDEDRRRERHTPDEPRGGRHPPRKLSASSDGRHQSNREYDERDEDYRWEKDHDRRGGSNFEDKKHTEYNEHGPQRDSNREGSYDWRAPDKDYAEKQTRNYNRDMDRQSSRESQKEFSEGVRKNDYDRKSSDSYEAKINADKQSEGFDRKTTGQEFNERKSDSYERKSIDKYERRDDRPEPNKPPERPDSRNSRHSRESTRDSFKPETFSDKEFTGSWADAPCEPYDKDAMYAKNNKIGFQEKSHFPEKTDTMYETVYASNYRDQRLQKDCKSDSDESKGGNYGKQQHMKKTPSNLHKTEVQSAQEKTETEENQITTPKVVETNVTLPHPPRTENSPKAWADSISPITIANESIKNQIGDSNKQDDKEIEKSRTNESKYHDSGKERVERKLSSSGSEKKSSNMGSRNRLDSGGSRRGFVVYRGGNWQGRGGDARRRGPGRGRSNRDSMYSESEVSGDEVHHHPERKPDKGRSARSPKGHMKKSEKDDRNRSVGNQNSSSNNQGSNQNENRPFPNESSGGNQRKRHDSRGEGREAFAPRGEPSRRGRGSFRGRGAVHMGYGPGPPSSKSPFGQPNSQVTDISDNDPSKSDNLSSDEKNKLKQQALSAGIIGRERRGVPPRMQDKNVKSRNRTGGSGEEEAWETTSEHSEGGTKQTKSSNKHQTNKQSAGQQANQSPKAPGADKKLNPLSQNRGANAPANRQNSSGSITRNNQPNKNDIMPFSSSTTTVNRVDDVKYNDTNAVTNALTDLKISGQKTVKDVKKIEKDSPEEHDVGDDGFQEVRSKKNVKDSRGQPSKEDTQQQNRSQKPQQGKPSEGQRNNSSTRSSSEKSGGSGGGRVNTGPPNPVKVNGPQSTPQPHDRQMGPPQNSNKPSQFDRLRQNNLPPRLARQREHNRIQKQIGQGFNPPCSNADLNPVPPSPISAWDKPINQSLRGNLETDQTAINTVIGNIESNDVGLVENHSAQSSQRSTPNNSATVEQKAPGSSVSMDKSSILDGTTTPVQTIIFENTNYKSAPEALKQKFVSSPTNGVPPKIQQLGTPKTMVPVNIQGSDLDNQILGFGNEAAQSAPFISDLISSDNSQSGVKQDSGSLQLPISFVSKNSEDSSDMKLDFAFDSELSQLTEDKTPKSLGLPRSIHALSSPSQNTISTATDQELNMKIASVKKVWDTSMPTVIEHTNTDDSNLSQHNMATQHMSVSSPHSLSSQHSMSAHHMTSQHNLASQHNLTSQHNLSQQLGSPHGMSQHNLVSQHGLGSQHNMSVSSSGQFTSGFEDHQNGNDVGQSQGFSPGGNSVNNQTTNVCKVKPTQQALHSASQGMSQSALQNMQATLIGQNTALQGMTATALQSMGNVGGGMQGVGGVMGLSPPPMQHAYNHINYPPSQYGGISAIPSPPTVVFNSSQQLPSQGGLYNAFQIDQSRNQFGGFPGGPYGAGSAPYNYQPQDMFQGLQGQYRMQDLFQATGAAAFGQSGQLGTNPSTVLISSSTNSLMSASVKPSTQQIGAIGTKGSTYQTQQYLGYGGPHDATAPPPYAAALPPPSLVRAAPQAAAAPPSLQPPNTYYSQNTGGQTGFYQQPGNVSANYGIQFGQPNQSHNSASIQSFGSQVLSSPFQMAAAAAMQQQFGRAAQQHQQQQQQQPQQQYGKQEHHPSPQPPHPSRPQQLKSPLQEHQNNGMFCQLSNSGFAQQGAGGHGGAPSPKGPQQAQQQGPNNKGAGGGFGQQQQQGGKSQQHSPPHHKYQQYQHMQQVIQPNGRQASLNMAISRCGLQQQRYPPPIQRPPPLPHHQPPPSYTNRSGGNRHPGGGPPHTRHAGGGYYQQNPPRSNQQTVTSSSSEPQKAITPGPESCPSPAAVPAAPALEGASAVPCTVALPAPAAPEQAGDKKE